MRLSNTQAVSRPVPADRNPVAQSNRFSGAALAPHAATVRVSYTVAAGKKGLISSLVAWVHAVTAATARTNPNIVWRLSPSGGNLHQLMQSQFYTNAVNDYNYQQSAEQVYANAGDLLEGVTGDSSTGGTVDYDLSHSTLQYDA